MDGRAPEPAPAAIKVLRVRMFFPVAPSFVCNDQGLGAARTQKQVEILLWQFSGGF